MQQRASRRLCAVFLSHRVVLALVLALASVPAIVLAEHTGSLAGTLGSAGAARKMIAIRWLPTRGRECERSGRYKRFCAGPRRAPQPFGAAADLARALGLGDKKTVSLALGGKPPDAWVRAAGTPSRADLVWPVENGKLWRGFGVKRQGAVKRRKHPGIDIGAPVGTPVRSVQNGLVVYADNGVRGYGNLLVTTHGDGSIAFYAHCRALYVFPGQTVKRGQVVGEVGTTGYARGPHLHFEYRKNGHLRDPMRWLDRPPE